MCSSKYTAVLDELYLALIYGGKIKHLIGICLWYVTTIVSLNI